MTPTLTAVLVPDPIERWEALGFEVVGGAIGLGDVQVVLGAQDFTAAIEGVSALAGLPLGQAPRDPPSHSEHPNGAIGIDHVVAVTPDFVATAGELERAGLAFKRIRWANGLRQGFRRLGGPILELVEAPQAPTRAWWGVTVTVPDLGALPGDLVSEPRPAVQPGRFICRARSDGVPLAFMTPEP